MVFRRYISRAEVKAGYFGGTRELIQNVRSLSAYRQTGSRGIAARLRSLDFWEQCGTAFMCLVLLYLFHGNW